MNITYQDCGWKGWGEISYGGRECVLRAKAAEYLVIQWIAFPLYHNNFLSLTFFYHFDSYSLLELTVGAMFK